MNNAEKRSPIPAQDRGPHAGSPHGVVALRFGNPGKRISFIEDATLKELRRRLSDREAAQPLQGWEKLPRIFLNPGFPSKPRANIRPRFQRYSLVGDVVTSCAK